MMMRRVLMNRGGHEAYRFNGSSISFRAHLLGAMNFV